MAAFGATATSSTSGFIVRVTIGPAVTGEARAYEHFVPYTVVHYEQDIGVTGALPAPMKPLTRKQRRKLFPVWPWSTPARTLPACPATCRPTRSRPRASGQACAWRCRSAPWTP